MRALTTVSVSLCLFALFSLSFAAPASDDHKKSFKPVECEKGKRFYKDEHGTNVKCHKFKDSKKDFHPRGFNGHSSALSVSSVNITNVGNDTETSGSYQQGESGTYQYNETANTGGNLFYPGSNLGNGNANNIIVYESRPGLGSACRATTTLVSAITTTLSATPSDDGGDDLLHLTAIVNALPTDALDEIL